MFQGESAMNRKTFYICSTSVHYQELELGDSIFEKCYLIENPNQADIVAIPDGGLDVQFVWTDEHCHGYVCGSFLKGKRSQISTYHRCFGLKLRPGVMFDFLTRESVSSFMEQRIPINEFLDISFLERSIQNQRNFYDLLQTSVTFFQQYHPHPSHCVANCVEDMILNAAGSIRISEMVAHLGYSHRYVNHIFKTQFGVPVKKYADIVRIQNAINILSVNDILEAIDCLGYYDQAHFIHEFKNYTSLTPKFYLDQLQQGRQMLIV